MHSCLQISKLMLDNYVDMQQEIQGVYSDAGSVVPERPHYSDNIIYLAE